MEGSETWCPNPTNTLLTYLEDPDDIDLNGEFDGVNEDEVEDLKRKYVLRLLAYDCAKLGTQSHSCPGTLLPHP